MYIDFHKAFDTVSHSKFIAKLATYSIRENLLSWIQEYLCGRSHCTRIGVAYSMLACMLSGIIQSSVIGPLLFLIFLNDIVELLASVGINVKVFADDMKIYINVTSNIDVKGLQTALDVITDWAQAWQLQVSVDKRYVLNLGKPVCDISLNINNNALPTCCDLGMNAK